MAELADAQVSKTCDDNIVWVRSPLPALEFVFDPPAGGENYELLCPPASALQYAERIAVS